MTAQAIARAVIRNTPILVLDEPAAVNRITAAISPATVKRSASRVIFRKLRVSLVSKATSSPSISAEIPPLALQSAIAEPMKKATLSLIGFSVTRRWSSWPKTVTAPPGR